MTLLRLSFSKDKLLVSSSQVPIFGSLALLPQSPITYSLSEAVVNYLSLMVNVPVCAYCGFHASSSAPSAAADLVSQGLLGSASWVACWGRSPPNLTLHLPLVTATSGSIPKEATNVCFGASFSIILNHPGTMNCPHIPTTRACHMHPFSSLLPIASQVLHTPLNDYQLRTSLKHI